MEYDYALVKSIPGITDLSVMLTLFYSDMNDKIKTSITFLMCLSFKTWMYDFFMLPSEKKGY